MVDTLKGLDVVLSARHMTVDTLAERTGISKHRLQRSKQQSGVFELSQIETITKELGVPCEALFVENPSGFSVLPDFRRSSPEPGMYRQGTIQAIKFVEQYSHVFSQLLISSSELGDIQFYSGSLTDTEATNLADQWRSNWALSFDDQIEANDANFVYKSLRSFIESLGIVVIHRSLQTDKVAGFYTQVADGPHTIVINTTKSSKARKLFTLAHEFCHVLLQKQGVSNPSVLKNPIEKFCNQFAAGLLMPERLISMALDRYRYTPSNDNDFIRLFAKKIGVSQQATFLRLVDLGYLTSDQYSQWISQFNGKIPRGDTGEGERGGPAPEVEKKKTTFGSTLIKLFAQAKNSDFLDEIDIFRITRIKPQYQNQLFADALNS